MSDQITQQQVNNAAWAACDTFRGVMDSSVYKDYVLTMLFLKYLSDVRRQRGAGSGQGGRTADDGVERHRGQTMQGPCPSPG